MNGPLSTGYVWLKAAIVSLFVAFLGLRWMKLPISNLCCHRFRRAEFVNRREVRSNTDSEKSVYVSCPYCRLDVDKRNWRKIFLDKSITCPLCRNKIKQDPPVCGPCGHVFCQKCVQSWIEETGKQ